MHAFILTVHIIISLMLIGLVLIQHGKGADAGASFGGGGAAGGASGSLFGSQGSASFLSRSSAVLAAIFFATSLTLAYFSIDQPDPARSVTQTVPADQKANETPADLPDLP